MSSTYSRMMRYLQTAECMEEMTRLYGTRDGVLCAQATRYKQCVKRHMELFNSSEKLYLLSAPGRVEIAGNHTDHQKGRVLAAAVNLDMIAVVSPRADQTVRLMSEGYPMLELSLTDLSVRPEEKGTTAALVRGVAAGMREHGFTVGGFDAAITSDVLSGSGLSSSAAMEVLLCAMLDAMYNGFRMDAVLRAQISQYAENVYFGKPCGLMDQMACSVGGIVAIDFKTADPKVELMQVSFSDMGYAMVVVNSRGSHDDLTDEYAAIREEMTAVAEYFGEEVLRRVQKEQVLMSVPALREKAGDRAVLRALHFFDENARVRRQTENLRSGDRDAFLRLINESGQSSWMLLQNVHVPGTSQPMAVALEMARTMLEGSGAWRVHGGGFAGTTLNFVPVAQVDEFVRKMEQVFDTGCCFVVDVRPVGPALSHVEAEDEEN